MSCFSLQAAFDRLLLSNRKRTARSRPKMKAYARDSLLVSSISSWGPADLLAINKI